MLALTDLATRALVIQGAEGDGGEEDGDVEEDGRGHVLQQGFITADDTWGGAKQSQTQALIWKQRGVPCWGGETSRAFACKWKSN